MTTFGTCAGEGCEIPARGEHGFCRKHWMRAHRRGEIKPQPTREERFWAKVNKTDRCWLWTGHAKTPAGYGGFTVGGRRQVLAHRYSYELARGPIPPGLVIDHLCRTPACVNPAHLEAVTERTNILRGVGATAVNAKRTHCPQGHPYSGENLKIKKDGSRRCVTCAREQHRVSDARRPPGHKVIVP